jgi:hypothetical protein
MTTRDEFIDAVDKLLLARKTLPTAEEPPTWVPARDGVGHQTKLPIAIGGVQYGAQLVVNSVSYIGAFHILLTYSDLCVSRLDFDDLEPHTNTMYAFDDGLPMNVSGRHFHRWSVNQRFVKGDGSLERLKHAEELPRSIHTFNAALRWFCDETNIHIPHGHRVELQGVLL